MTPPPLVERRRPDRVGPRTALRLVPRLQLRIDEIPRELVDDQQRRQRREPVDGLAEWIEMVDDAARDDRVERAVHLAEVRLPEARPRRRARIDADRDVARVDERRDDAAPVAAPDLEHTRRSLRQVM